MAIAGSLQTMVAVSQAAPSDFTVAAYNMVNFEYDATSNPNASNLGELMNLGEFGREYNVVTALNLADGATRKFKGSFNNGSVSMELLFDSDNTSGQHVIEAAETSRNPYYFKVTFPSNEVFYFEALVTTVKRMVGGPDDALKLRVQLEITHREILETVTA